MRARLEEAANPQRRHSQEGHEATAKPKGRGTKKAQARPAAGVAAASPKAKTPPPAGGGGPAEGLGGVSMSRELLMKSTVKELRERCKAVGVPTSGKKADIVDRLLASGLVKS